MNGAKKRVANGWFLALGAALGCVSLAVLFIACATPGSKGLAASARFQITERGEDFATYSRISIRTNQDGTLSRSTNSLTLVDNGMNYLDNGVWKPSEDTIESTENEVVARRGPIRGAFNRKLSPAHTFELTSSGGTSLQGGVRALRVTDNATGQSAVIGTIRTNVLAEVVPPNRIVYRNAFEGVGADVVLIWRHNLFSQNVILRERPNLPPGFNPESSHFEIVSEFQGNPPAAGPRAALRKEGEPGTNSIRGKFDRFEVAEGRAFNSPAGSEGWKRLGTVAGEGRPVAKKSRAQAAGENILIDSVDWKDLMADTRELRPQSDSARPLATEAAPGPANSRLRTLADEPSEPPGYVFHIPILANSSLTNFAAGRTYVIVNTFYSGQPIAFETNCCIKFATPNSSLLLYGAVSFPDSAPGPVFTSKDDDLFGEVVTGMYDASGHLVVEGSDGWAYDNMAAQALWLYYPRTSNTVKNARFRWAQTALRYDFNPGVEVKQFVEGVAFENCTTGIRVATGNSPITVANVRMCNVHTPTLGAVTGGIVNDCDVVNASAFPRSQQEPAIAVRAAPGNPSRTEILIVAMDQFGISPPGLLRMTSPDGGVTWTRTRFANFQDESDGFKPASTDSDPEVAADAFGNFYLAYSTPSGTAFYYSATGGDTWNAMPGFNNANTGLHMPRLATGPSGKPGVPGSVWITKQATGRLTAVGTEVYGLGDVRSAWTPDIPLPTYGGQNPNPPFPAIAVGPSGQVALMHVVGRGREFREAPVTYNISVDNDGLGTGGFIARTTFEGNLGWEEVAAANEIFPFASLSWDWARNRLYAAYPDRTSPNSETNSQVDISLRYSNNAAVSWSGKIQVNDARNNRSRFQPRVAVDQSTGYVAVWWYDCRNDPQNIKVNLYGAISTDLFATPMPKNFQMNPRLFQGSVTTGDFKEYMGGTFFRGRFYPVWLDSSNSTGDNPDGTQTFDIYLARMPH